MEFTDPPHSPLRRIRWAAGLLTLWRPHGAPPPDPEELRQATAFYPLIGLAIGLFPAAALLLPYPADARGVLALAAWAIVTGAGTLGGWARACDAAFAPPVDAEDETRRRRTEALQASRLGVVGGTALGVLLLAKAAALGHAPPVAPMVAAALGRWAAVHALHTYAAAPPHDARLPAAGAVPLWSATWVAVAVLSLLTLASPEPARTAYAVTAGAVLALAAAAFLVDRFAGVNGPVCDAVCEAAEVAVLWMYVPWG
ncbi:MAG TPA: adenosylcobinamide-GDP ribazoletransferase [Longimicrobium sp.]|jgi:adenosylcobinamide-GDP ribazoletransferase|uniref:adenosylcobinamide-GDP ribazoletransferase n=1 Tax=Longimicrobium sp. TaxID=2029185 RepID=UPI002ED9884F